MRSAAAAKAAPAALVGAVFEDQIDERLGKPWIIAVSLIVFGIVLWWADRLKGRRRLEGHLHVRSEV